MDRFDAQKHYAHTGFAVADVNIGEDAYGIWVAGAVRPGATEEQIAALRAGGQSGDWRNNEMIASLTVNVPGFPMALVSGRESALVAAGARPIFKMAHPAVIVASAEPAVESFRDESLRLAMQPLLRLVRNTNRKRLADALK
jgi:hypothetical protein